MAPKADVERWRDMVADVAGALEVWYMLGLMDRLSGGDPDYEGPLGGRGLYQIHPNTAARLNMDPDDLYEPRVSASVAAQLVATRAMEINDKDPDMVAERPADLTLLATASYLWGPGILLPAIRPGDTAAEVFARLDPAIGEFAVDVLRRGAAYRDQAGDELIDPGAREPPDGEPPAEGPSLLRTLAWLIGIPLVVGGAYVWFRGRDAE